jgi:hypothetical protein
MVLRKGLSDMVEKYEIERLRLPLCPSFKCKELLIKESIHFNSAAKPIAMHFLGENSKYSIIYKVRLSYLMRKSSKYCLKI